ncbi:MAG: adenylate cyclase, partial [Akkermansiaceae bacterium]|nr:adenylate cyclase [Akkermansiaceae bacterium]
ARLYSDLDALNQSYARFVPHQFLDILEKRSIVDVEIGDQVQGEMTILFSDIEGFTGMSEAMTPEETFELVNRYFQR